MPYFVYIVKSASSSQFYIGHTDNLSRRLAQHNDPRYHGTKHTKC
ncbi:MAG: GIY-YIG nuclease family protein [Nitrospirota bacterium]